MELDAVVKRVAPFLKAADDVTVVETFADLPFAVKTEANNQGAQAGKVEGVFHSGYTTWSEIPSSSTV